MTTYEWIKEVENAEELFKIYSHGYAVDKKGNIIE